MQVTVSAVTAIAVRRPPGANILVVNQSAVDVYFDSNPNRLNATAPGVVPSGTKIAANGGQAQWAGFPGIQWFRAIQDTTIEVQP